MPPRLRGIIFRKTGAEARRFCNRACKPGSVVDSHLSRRTVARALQPPPRRQPGQALCSSTVLLRIEFTAPRCLHAAGELLPRLSILTLQGRAVSFCCTFPGVTPGRRYLLSLPYGARTFLTAGAFGASRAAVRPGCKVYCSGLLRKCQSLLQICLGKAIIKIIMLRADTRCAKNQMAGAEARPAEGKDRG